MSNTMIPRVKRMGLIVKTWERCKSLGRGGPNRAVRVGRTKSCPVLDDGLEEDRRVRKRRVAPEGCFTVYVGPERQRFVVKTEHANHALFKALLEEAESEYGYSTVGPISLPCNVDVFCRVLLEMDGRDESAEPEIRRGCGFAGTHGSYRLLTSPVNRS